MLKQALKKWLKRQMFDPTLAGAFVNPFFITRRALVRAMRRCAHHVRGRVLDVGCGQKPYESLFTVSEYLGVEIDSPENRQNNRVADYFYDGRRLPFGDSEFDTVLCNQVLEHVFEPEEFVAELSRVLRPGGLLILTVPFVWDEHEQPFDYARYSSFGLKHLISKHGLSMQEQVKTCTDVSMLWQLGNAYIFKVTRTRSNLVNLLLTAVLMAPGSLFGLLAGRVLPGNPDLYLDNIIVALKPPALSGEGTRR